MLQQQPRTTTLFKFNSLSLDKSLNRIIVCTTQCDGTVMRQMSRSKVGPWVGYVEERSSRQYGYVEVLCSSTFPGVGR